MIVVQVRFFGGSHLFTRRLNPAIERASARGDIA